VLNTLGEERFGVSLVLLNLVVLPPAFYIGSGWGVTGIAAAWLIVYPVLTVPLFLKVGMKLEMSVWSYVRAVAPPLVASVIMAAGVAGTQHLLGSGMAAALRLLIQVVTGAVLYLAALVILYPDRIREYRELYVRFRTAKQAASV
jgi:teichuronic acid exporter